MLIFVLLAGTAAAALNAGSTLLQRMATGMPHRRSLFSRKFALAVTRHPLFLFGLVLQIIAAGLHILALSQGSLLVVQPLLTLDLVFLVIYLYFRYRLKIGAREWLAVGAIVAGLSGLFVIADPKNGQTPYHLAPWLLTTGLICFGIALSILITKRSPSPKIRAAAAGIASACAYALNASYAKLSLNLLRQGGFHSLFIHWPLYALLVSAIFSIFLMQNAYGAGPLVISQPLMESVDPLLSSVIGIFIFGDIVNHSPLAIVGESLSALLLLVGIISLGGSKKIYIKFKP